MARSRREKTLADYVVIALSPALIMLLVGSLSFFLLAVAYRGQFEGRVQWVLFWFVMGAVLVARIAIEQGKEHAQLFGWVLSGLTGLFCYRFLESDVVVIAWVLLAVIWWCSWKLTWDCTLIDDSEDASGEGLIEAAGLAGRISGAPPQNAKTPNDNRLQQADAGPASGDRPPEPQPSALDPSRPTGKPHAPGRWVVYFSLAALPLFGVGQLLIPAAQAGRRSYAFLLLAVYVASALGLLLTTSFLGLRRYLRQRKLQMPAAMTATWIGMGTALAVALLLIALLIPRPQGEYTITEWIDRIDAKARDASRLALLRDNRGEGPGRGIGQHDRKADQAGENPPPDQKQADQKPGERKPDDQPPQQNAQEGGEKADPQANSRDDEKRQAPGGKSDQDDKRQQSGQQHRGDQQAKAKNDSPQRGQQGKQDQQQGNQNQQQAAQQQDDRQQQEKQAGQNANAGKPVQRPPAPSPATSASWMTSFLTSLAPFVKWILYGLLAAVIAYFLIRHWSSLIETLIKLWNELLNLFGLTPKRQSESGAAEEEAIPAPPKPFSFFNDPFLSGQARRMSPAQLVRYTFEALEAWSREQGLPRSPEQTPLEFASELCQKMPAASKEVSQTAQIYARVAYARGTLSNDSFDSLERMWRRMNVMASV